MKDAVRRSVEFRSARQACIERGLASGAAARKSGKYVSAATVLSQLARHVAKARNGSGRAAGKAVV